MLAILRPNVNLCESKPRLEPKTKQPYCNLVFLEIPCELLYNFHYNLTGQKLDI